MPTGETLGVTLVGGPTALLEYRGLRFLTDPAFSPPGEQPDGLVKTTPPALSADDVGQIDAILVSHDQHSDNLDADGRAFLPRAPRTLTTPLAAERLGGNAVGMEPWSSMELDGVTVTAVPAQHGPDGSEPLVGPVTGFVLSAPGRESVYVSGDNASLDVVRAIGDRVGSIGVAVLFAGAVSLPYRFDGAYLTLSADHAAEAAKLLGVRVAVPLHFEGWAHFTQGEAELRAAFHGNGVADLLAMPARGERLVV